VLELAKDSNPYVAARAVWLLPYLGDEGLARTKELLKDANPVNRRLAFQSLRRANHDVLAISATLATDADLAVRRDVATSLHAVAADKAVPILVELAKRLDVTDKNSLAAFGIGAAGKESAVWAAVKSAYVKNGETWSPQVSRIAWVLHTPEMMDELVAQASGQKVPAAQRTLATETLSFVESKEAALAMIKLAGEGSPVKGEAATWALMRMTGTWSAFDIRSELKKAGVYDEAKVVVVPAPVPEAPKSTFTVQDVLSKKGDAIKGGELVQRCTMCHQVGAIGANYGPELRGFAARQGVESVVTAIVEPSASIALGYEGSTLKLKAGGQIDGLIQSNNDPVVVKSAGGVSQLVPKNRIDKQSKLNRSLMLSSDQLGLTAQDVADIAAWLATYN
jgi:putative heme-binding domain-containing protein